MLISSLHHLIENELFKIWNYKVGRTKFTNSFSFRFFFASQHHNFLQGDLSLSWYSQKSGWKNPKRTFFARFILVLFNWWINSTKRILNARLDISYNIYQFKKSMMTNLILIHSYIVRGYFSILIFFNTIW